MTSTVAPLVPSRTAIRATLWVAQGLLGAAFVVAGFMKSTAPIDALAQQMTWVTAFPAEIVRFIGLAELAGGLGLVLPSLTRIKPFLTPVAAVGLVTVMALAAAFHVSRGEGALIVPNLVLGAVAAFIAWGRFKLAPISPRL